jgi:hypothetical protein
MEEPRFEHFKKHYELIQKSEDKRGSPMKPFFLDKEKITSDRVLLNRIPSQFFNTSDTQRMLIIKYFEDDTKYAKVIPRTISYINQRLQKEHDHMTEEISASLLIDLIKQDDSKLENLNPMTQVQFVDPDGNIQILGTQTFYFSKTNQETIINLFVKRKNPDIHIEDFTVTFLDFEACKQYVMEIDESITLALRYYDQIYNGYTFIGFHTELPESRIYKKGNIIKLLVQTFRVKERRRSSVRSVEFDSEIMETIKEREKAFQVLTMCLPTKKRSLDLHLKFESVGDKTMMDLLKVTSELDTLLLLVHVFPTDLKDPLDVKYREGLEVKEAGDVVLGVYCGDGIEATEEYEGTTDTVVFSLSPFPRYSKWTKKNDYFCLATEKGLSIGGGGDGPALFLDENLKYGVSQRSATFDNVPLCATYIHFTIKKIEAFTFQ